MKELETFMSLSYNQIDFSKIRIQINENQSFVFHIGLFIKQHWIFGKIKYLNLKFLDDIKKYIGKQNL